MTALRTLLSHGLNTIALAGLLVGGSFRVWSADPVVQKVVSKPPPSQPSTAEAQGRATSRIVPTDPFLTNLLQRPKMIYGGLGVELARNPTAAVGQLFHWREEGGFGIVSRNYSPVKFPTDSGGFALFRLNFP